MASGDHDVVLVRASGSIARSRSFDPSGFFYADRIHQLLIVGLGVLPDGGDLRSA